MSAEDIQKIISGQIILFEQRSCFEHWKNCSLCRDKLQKQISGVGFVSGGRPFHSISMYSTGTTPDFHFAGDERSVIAASFDKDSLLRTLLQLPEIDILSTPTNFLINTGNMISNFFAGKPIPRVPINPILIKTDFMRRVLFWVSLVPFGKIITYGDIAVWLRQAGASRAVGRALHRNPTPLFIPCHRVVGKSGSLIGFAAGVQTKKLLLNIEGNSLE